MTPNPPSTSTTPLPKSYIGNLSAYEPETTSLSVWLELLENFCDLNEITSTSSKCKLLLNYLSVPVYTDLRTQLLPVKPKEKTFDELVTLLRSTYEPTKLLFSDIQKFESRNQDESETTAAFLTALRLLADRCSFGSSLKDRLLIRFVNGLKSVRLKRKLWDKADLTLEEAVRFAKNEETILTELKEAESVNRITRSYPKPPNNSSRNYPPQVASSSSSNPPRLPFAHPSNQNPAHFPKSPSHPPQPNQPPNINPPNNSRPKNT